MESGTASVRPWEWGEDHLSVREVQLSYQEFGGVQFSYQEFGELWLDVTTSPQMLEKEKVSWLIELSYYKILFGL